MKSVKQKDETLHTGSDWYKKYVLHPKNNFDGAKAVMKIRDIRTDLVICEAICEVNSNIVIARIPNKLSLKIPRNIRKARYDLFIILPLENGEFIQYKLVMGEFKIIHESSLH